LAYKGEPTKKNICDHFSAVAIALRDVNQFPISNREKAYYDRWYRKTLNIMKAMKCKR